MHSQCRRNEIHNGGGGLPLIFLLTHFTVIREIYYMLHPKPPSSDGPALMTAKVIEHQK